MNSTKEEPTTADRAREAIAALREERDQRGMSIDTGLDLVEAAQDLARRWYDGVLDDLVEDVLNALASGAIDDDGVEDYMSSLVHQCDAVVSARQSAMVLLATGVEPDARSTLNPASDSGDIASWMLFTDLLEAMERLDVVHL